MMTSSRLNEEASGTRGTMDGFVVIERKKLLDSVLELKSQHSISNKGRFWRLRTLSMGPGIGSVEFHLIALVEHSKYCS